MARRLKAQEWLATMTGRLYQASVALAKVRQAQNGLLGLLAEANPTTTQPIRHSLSYAM
jgi:hypothetical protein